MYARIFLCTGVTLLHNSVFGVHNKIETLEAMIDIVIVKQ